MNKQEIANILEEVASLLELKGEDPFRIRAYRGGARAVLNLDEDLRQLIREERLTEITGIGDHLAQVITFLSEGKKWPLYEELKKEIPKGLLEMMQLQGLGPKKVKALYDKLHIRSIADLKKALQKGKLAHLRGFGKKTEEKLLHAMKLREKGTGRILWWDAWEMAWPLLDRLKKSKGVQKAEICGSLRRKLETVGDLDFLVAAEPIDWVMKTFLGWGEEVLARGETKASIRLLSGMQVDLRVVTLDQFPFALHHFTGSKEHNIKIRTHTLKRGWSLSEYGLEPLRKGKKAPPIQSEKDLYEAIGLSYVPPELREDRGEIEAAAKGKIPRLIEEREIQGTLHNHTTASDGRNTLREMVAKGEALGWSYLGISDHSQSSVQANGLSEERLYEQVEMIRRLNRTKDWKIHVLAGSECDILPNGKLDYSDSVLRQLDFVIASVHSSLGQDEKTITKRIIRALENPYVSILGHLTSRILLERDPTKVNVKKVVDAAIANRKIIELNGHPKRLDMDWRYWKEAAERGLLCCINCDAHAVGDLEFVRAGVNVARKGWLTKEAVVNTFPLKKLLPFIRKNHNYSDTSDEEGGI